MNTKPSLRTKLFSRYVSGLIVVMLGLAPATPAFALLGSVKVPSASQILSDVERRYNIDTNAVREQGQQFNVSDQKKLTPEVSLYFSPSDPKPGTEVTALALPIYFSTPEAQMYYTWYLKRLGCDLKNAPITATESASCDRDGDGRITVEDWKIEAMRTLASNNFDAPAVYPADTDDDGYKARYGGDSKVGVRDYCYYHDNVSGENYEISDSTQDVSFSCTGGRKPVCMLGKETISPGQCEVEGGTGGTGGGSGTGGTGGDGGSASCDTFVAGTDGLTVSGIPICTSGGVAQCYVGGACCVSDPLTATTCEQSLIACSGGGADGNPICRHLFPNAPGAVTGNGTFGQGEEQFWRTDPQDPSTADNGNKDEANVAGLGQKNFTWNFLEGDMIGVVVEGTAMMSTKHDDSSGMIMWAFSKNDCPIGLASGTGSYNERVRGYTVTFPTVSIDLNKCLERNLVDPTQGGQATNLEIQLSATPEDPLNDGSGKGDGDTIEVVANVNNAAKGLTDTYFDWRVEVSPNGTPNPPSWNNVVTYLTQEKLLSAVRGNGLNTIRLRLNVPANTVAPFLSGNVGYLRFRLDARENFNSAGVLRKGSASIIVKFFAATDRIRAYLVGVTGDPARVSLLSDREICSGGFNPTDPTDKQALDKLESKVCRVLENEIIGLELPNPNNAYSNFSWTINGKPLVCNSKVSPNCPDDRQNNTNFFPVIGKPNDLLTVTLTANKIELSSSTEKTTTLSRVFRIVEPAVEIRSGNIGTAWPKVLGNYTDENGQSFIEQSKDTLQALPGSDISLQAAFIPNFLGASPPPRIGRSWTVDEAPLGDESSNQISFTTSKPEGSIYNVVLSAVYRPSDLIRKALSDIWGISVLDATEQYFQTALQLEHPPSSLLPQKPGPQKYLALITSYLPASVVFALRILLSIGLILFISGILHAIIPTSRSVQRKLSF